MPLSDFLSDTLASIGQSVKKLPTSTVGGIADLGNLILGGYANIADLAQGKQITRSAGEGLVSKPTGGSEQLNDLFGISNESKGLVENSMSAMLGVLNPATALKTAMIVPAVLLKSGKTIQLAEAALGKGRSAQEVFANTGVYKDPADGMMKAVMDDSKAALRTDVIPRGGETTTLDKVLDHPALFEAYPDLAKVTVSSNKSPMYSSAYHAWDNRIALGAEADTSELLHETQHAIQEGSGFATGGNSSMFFRDRKSFNSAAQKSTDIMDSIDPAALQQTMDPTALLEAKNASKLATVLNGAIRKSKENYLNIAGEKEARTVQEMYETNNYSTLPTDMKSGSTGKLISDPLMGNKVDNDPAVSAVVKYLNSLIDSSPASK